jgi:hypothetical protein
VSRVKLRRIERAWVVLVWSSVACMATMFVAWRLGWERLGWIVGSVGVGAILASVVVGFTAWW